MLKAKYFILLICLSFLLKTEAKVTLTSIWGDNMVLQQQSEVTFSGTATSGKRVQATRKSINYMYIRPDHLTSTLPILLLTYGTGMNSGKWNGMKTESEWEKCNATKDMILQPKQSVLTKKR